MLESLCQVYCGYNIFSVLCFRMVCLSLLYYCYAGVAMYGIRCEAVLFCRCVRLMAVAACSFQQLVRHWSVVMPVVRLKKRRKHRAEP